MSYVRYRTERHKAGDTIRQIFRSGQGSGEALESQQWYFVSIDAERPPSARAVHTAFETLLVEAFNAAGRPPNCRVYPKGHQIQGFSYFFSPPAAVAFEVVIRIWKRVGVSEPTNIHQMKIIIYERQPRNNLTIYLATSRAL